MASSTCGRQMTALVGQLTGTPRTTMAPGWILVQRHGGHRIMHPRRLGLGLCSQLPTATIRGEGKVPFQEYRLLHSWSPTRGEIGTRVDTCRNRQVVAVAMPGPDTTLMLPFIGSRQASENRLPRPRAAAPPHSPGAHGKVLLGRAGHLHSSVESFAVRSAMRRMRLKPARTSSSRGTATRTLGRTSVELRRLRHLDPYGIA